MAQVGRLIAAHRANTLSLFQMTWQVNTPLTEIAKDVELIHVGAAKNVGVTLIPECPHTKN